MGLTDDLSADFFSELKAMCGRLGCAPLDMAKVMFSEGGCSATAHNPASDASGLIQFIPGTLRGLGWEQGTSVFRGLTAEEQLPWVEKFFQPFKSKGLTTVSRVYQAVFLPASLNSGISDDTVICGAAGPFPAAYASNQSVDIGGKGFISVADLRAAVESRARGPRWAEITMRLGVEEMRPGQPRPGEIVTVNGIAPGFDGFRLPDGQMLEMEIRISFPMVPPAAKAVFLELFRHAGRIEVFHGNGLYAGQVGWADLPYLQLRVELGPGGKLSFRGNEGAVMQRLGILGYEC